MRNSSLKTDIIADEILEILLTEEIDDKSLNSILREHFCTLSEAKIDDLTMIISRLVDKNKGDSVEIVSTTPVSFKLKNRKTYPVLKEAIMSAQRSITLTGYSISDHFDELLNLINQKSKQGVSVELFLNNYEDMKQVFNDIDIKNKSFFKVFNYSGVEGDDMASLHAKTLVVDQKRVFISSANLSYHGMISNIEIGVLIESQEKANQILDIFKELKRTKKFSQVNN
jgi:phosphatidylserine/phosphatidylglycerophosphate/cardiolipin synthase-like enzyme